MLCIWWNQLGVIYWKLLKPNETITENVYGHQLMRLKEAMQKEQPICHERHDNARPQIASLFKTYLEEQNWAVSLQSPYSADIAASDYHLFRAMMAYGLPEQHFTSYEEL